MTRRATLHLKSRRPLPQLVEPMDQPSTGSDKSPKPLKGYFSESGFSAAPLARSAAVATDTEWEAAARRNAPRMVIEGMKAIQQDPAQLEQLARVPGMLELANAIVAFVGSNKIT
jgi:hypothetical protein